MNDLPHVSHLSALDIQREQANQLHDQDVTHIIAAEAEFANLFPEDQVDTLILLQIPSVSSASSNFKMSCMGTAYPTNWLLCYNSTVLRDSGFEKFVQLLDDERYQKRRASKLLLSGQLGPNGAEIMKKIRYVLDLGPSADSDLRSEHLEALTLPKGIVQYSMMTRLESSRRAPISAAGGHDDACHCFDMKIRGAKCEEPGYWINGQHKPLTVQGNAVPVTTHTSSSSTTTATTATTTTAVAEREVEIDMFNSIFGRDTDNEPQSPGQAAETGPIFTSSAPYVSNDGNPIPSIPSSTAPQGPEIMHAPVDSPTLHDGSLTGAIWDLPLSPEFRIDDYCEIRHIANVIRLLLAMAGKPLLLNSAARVYTIAGLAKLFRLKSSDAYYIYTASKSRSFSDDQQGGYAFANKLRSWISDWFFEWNNINIVDTLPEECFIIAWNIKLPVVARVAYRILVAEHALQEAGNTNAQPRKFQSRQKTVFGRELSGLLDEDMETMIDHSSEALVQRILKTRDAHFAEMNACPEQLSPMLESETAVTAGAGSSPNPAINVVRKYDLEPVTAIFQAFGGPIHKLQLTAQALADFAPTEKRLARFNTDDLLEPRIFPIANALAAVRRLLDRIALIVRVCFPPNMPDSDLLHTTYTEDVQKSLSFYVRQTTLHKNWFVHVYNDLSDDKKSMTAVYWRLLARFIEDKLTVELGNGQFLDLVTAVNDTLLTALVYNVPLGTAETRANLRLDLLERLQPMIGDNVTLASIESMYELNGFQSVDIRYALYNHANRLYKKIYERDSLSPEFELAMLKPSPHLLLGLSADEFRFLPLWAGGDNDGTGAVFEPALPTAHLGPISPGPEYHTGTTMTNMSTASIDDALSMAGPPSISEDGQTERYRDMAMSDAGGTARGHGDSDDDGQSVSSSFIMVRNFDGLRLAAAQVATVSAPAPTSSAWNYAHSMPSNASRAVQDGHSTLTGTSIESFATPSSSSSMTTSSFDDVVVVRPTAVAAATTTATAAAAASTGGDDFDLDDDDGIYNYEDDDDVEDQEYYDDDDDDAKSDDTVMPDREEVEQAMRQDQAMQESRTK
ncbi:hypothetical protein Sste5346_001573 [Sporothrix stenoceras]|uniref:Uncharacterized protein n=1 Tax=Sporothrix stenoceras TaxID=5173 RepID=A0ABR3ZN20_9PEZI